MPVLSRTRKRLCVEQPDGTAPTAKGTLTRGKGGGSTVDVGRRPLGAHVTNISAPNTVRSGRGSGITTVNGAQGGRRSDGSAAGGSNGVTPSNLARSQPRAITELAVADIVAAIAYITDKEKDASFKYLTKLQNPHLRCATT